MKVPTLDSRRRWLHAAGAFALLALGGCKPPAPLYKGIDLASTEYGGDFTLAGPGGKPVTPADFSGSYVLLFFGYTQCPDVCPTALSRAVEIRKLVGEAGRRLRVVFVTVDPERDSREILDQYVAAFDPSFLGLSGTPEQLREVARSYKIFYRKIGTMNSYTIDHTALTYVLDPFGRVRLALRHEQSAADCADDLRRLMDYDERRKA